MFHGGMNLTVVNNSFSALMTGNIPGGLNAINALMQGSENHKKMRKIGIVLVK